MEDNAPVRVLAPDTTMTSKYWETVVRKSYSQPEKELMLAVLKDAIMNYRKRMHLGNILFNEAEAWLFERERDRLFSFETVCAVLGLSPGKIRNELLAWKLNALSDLSGKRNGRWSFLQSKHENLGFNRSEDVVPMGKSLLQTE